MCIRDRDKNGKVVSAPVVSEEDELMLMTTAGQSVRIKVCLLYTSNLDIDAIVNTLVVHKDAGVESWLTLTTGTLECANLGDIQFSKILSIYGIRVTGRCV